MMGDAGGGFRFTCTFRVPAFSAALDVAAANCATGVGGGGRGGGSEFLIVIVRVSLLMVSLDGTPTPNTLERLNSTVSSASGDIRSRKPFTYNLKLFFPLSATENSPCLVQHAKPDLL